MGNIAKFITPLLKNGKGAKTVTIEQDVNKLGFNISVNEIQIYLTNQELESVHRIATVFINYTNDNI